MENDKVKKKKKEKVTERIFPLTCSSAIFFSGCNHSGSSFLSRLGSKTVLKSVFISPEVRSAV